MASENAKTTSKSKKETHRRFYLPQIPQTHLSIPKKQSINRVAAIKLVGSGNKAGVLTFDDPVLYSLSFFDQYSENLLHHLTQSLHKYISKENRDKYIEKLDEKRWADDEENRNKNISFFRKQWTLIIACFRIKKHELDRENNAEITIPQTPMPTLSKTSHIKSSKKSHNNKSSKIIHECKSEDLENAPHITMNEVQEYLQENILPDLYGKLNEIKIDQHEQFVQLSGLIVDSAPKKYKKRTIGNQIRERLNQISEIIEPPKDVYYGEMRRTMRKEGMDHLIRHDIKLKQVFYNQRKDEVKIETDGLEWRYSETYNCVKNIGAKTKYHASRLKRTTTKSYNIKVGTPAISQRAKKHHKFDENEIKREQMDNDVYEFMMNKDGYRSKCLYQIWTRRVGNKFYLVLYKDIKAFFTNQFSTYIKHHAFYDALRIPHVINHEKFNDELAGLYKDKDDYINPQSDKQPLNTEIIPHGNNSIIKFNYVIHPLLSYDTPGHLKGVQNKEFVQCVGSGGDCLNAGASQCFDSVSWANIGNVKDGGKPYQDFTKEWTKHYDKEFAINILVTKHTNKCVYWRFMIHILWRLDLSALIKGLQLRAGWGFESNYVESYRGDMKNNPYKSFDGDRVLWADSLTPRKLLQTPEYTLTELENMKKKPAKYTRKFIEKFALQIWSLMEEDIAKSKEENPFESDEWHYQQLDNKMKLLGIPFKRPGCRALLHHALCNLHIDCGCAKLNVKKPMSKLLKVQTTKNINDGKVTKLSKKDKVAAIKNVLDAVTEQDTFLDSTNYNIMTNLTQNGSIHVTLNGDACDAYKPQIAFYICKMAEVEIVCDDELYIKLLALMFNTSHYDHIATQLYNLFDLSDENLKQAKEISIRGKIINVFEEEIAPNLNDNSSYKKWSQKCIPLLALECAEKYNTGLSRLSGEVTENYGLLCTKLFPNTNKKEINETNAGGNNSIRKVAQDLDILKYGAEDHNQIDLEHDLIEKEKKQKNEINILKSGDFYWEQLKTCGNSKFVSLALKLKQCIEDSVPKYQHKVSIPSEFKSVKQMLLAEQKKINDSRKKKNSPEMKMDYAQIEKKRSINDMIIEDSPNTKAKAHPRIPKKRKRAKKPKDLGNLIHSIE